MSWAKIFTVPPKENGPLWVPLMGGTEQIATFVSGVMTALPTLKPVGAGAFLVLVDDVATFAAEPDAVFNGAAFGFGLTGVVARSSRRSGTNIYAVAGLQSA